MSCAAVRRCLRCGWRRHRESYQRSVEEPQLAVVRLHDHPGARVAPMLAPSVSQYLQHDPRYPGTALHLALVSNI